MFNNKLKSEYSIMKSFSANMISLLDISSLYLQDKDKELK